jgi:hypothetical protein
MRNNSYQYYNRNPDGRHLEDCVCRAISTATGLNYEAVNNLLSLTASCYMCEKLCVCCYYNLLENILCYKRYTCYNGETVEDIAKKHCREKVLIRIDAHLTSSIKGTIYDIWDCSQKEVDCYWIIT